MNHHQELEGWYLVMLNHRYMFDEIQKKEELLYIQKKRGDRWTNKSEFVFYIRFFFLDYLVYHFLLYIVGFPFIFYFHIYIYIYIRDAFNKFSDFFCTGISVCYCYTSYEMTDFYDFRFKWTATAGIGIYPTKAWLSQLVNFKN